MPSVKIPRKSTDFDMTPFVDVAFLILSFFMLATKFKPPEPVTVTTPKSVNADKLKEIDGLLVTFDSAGRVFATMTLQKPSVETGNGKLFGDLISAVNAAKSLGLTQTEKDAYIKSPMIGVPFSQLKRRLQGGNVPETGIPVDSTNNELAQWIASLNEVYRQNSSLNLEPIYMIKGDNNSSYPSFKGVIDAFRTNEVFRFQLVTDPKSVPAGTDYYREINAN